MTNRTPTRRKSPGMSQFVAMSLPPLAVCVAFTAIVGASWLFGVIVSGAVLALFALGYWILGPMTFRNRHDQK
jgi:uncharacterized MnhB-related membrane protein